MKAAERPRSATSGFSYAEAEPRPSPTRSSAATPRWAGRGRTTGCAAGPPQAGAPAIGVRSPGARRDRCPRPHRSARPSRNQIGCAGARIAPRPALPAVCGRSPQRSARGASSHSPPRAVHRRAGRLRSTDLGTQETPGSCVFAQRGCRRSLDEVVSPPRQSAYGLRVGRTGRCGRPRYLCRPRALLPDTSEHPRSRRAARAECRR